MTIRMTRTTTARRGTAVAALALSGLLALSACGSSDDSTVASGGDTPAASSSAIPESAPYNAQDVSFVSDMKPHHAQAVEMADIILGKSPSAPVKALAEKIKAEQSPEITQLDQMLATFGATGSSGMSHDMGSMSSGSSMSMPGMMSDADMTAFKNATGTEAEKQFLSMMTEHHSGAITMAEQEISGGEYTQAVDLAKSIKTAQQGEITEMKQLLASL